MRIVVATRNRHKLAEIRAILDVPSLVLAGADEMEGLPDVEEDGETFEANAMKKAVTVAKAAGLWALADDSGLEVAALGGEPGVRSARYAGEPSDHAANIVKLLAALRGVSDRRARFRCVLALASPAGDVSTAEGECAGRIEFAPRGSGGFGYDPVFVPDGYRQTFAEMTPQEKDRISHRGRALETARRAWADRLAEGTAGSGHRAT
jgi:XTP/dITP diphosphohydrolase